MSKFKNTVVNVKTQEEWDIVSKFHKLNWYHRSSQWTRFGEVTCINIDNNYYGDKNCYLNTQYKIISFQQWQIIVNMIPKLEMLESDCIIKTVGGYIYCTSKEAESMIEIFPHKRLHSYSYWDTNLECKNDNYNIQTIHSPNGDLIWEREKKVKVKISELINCYEKQNNVKVIIEIEDHN